MKDSLKEAIEELVVSHTRIFRDNFPKRVVVTISADRKKENPLSREYRDPTEILSHTGNRFLNHPVVFENGIKVEKIPLYREGRTSQDGDYVVYVMDWLDSNCPLAI